MKKRLYLKDTEAREEGNTFSVIADFEGNEEQFMDIELNEILTILHLRNIFLFKVLFILDMITNLSICIFIIDISAKDMLGTDAYLLNSFIDDINMDGY